MEQSSFDDFDAVLVIICFVIDVLVIKYILIIEQQKKALKIFGSRTYCTKKPFGYQVAHHGYFLLSCPGQIFNSFFYGKKTSVSNSTPWNNKHFLGNKLKLNNKKKFKKR